MVHKEWNSMNVRFSSYLYCQQILICSLISFMQLISSFNLRIIQMEMFSYLLFR